MEFKKIVLRKGRGTYLRRPVILSTTQYALLKGKGEGASISIKAEKLKYEDTKNNKQDASRSIHTE